MNMLLVFTLLVVTVSAVNLNDDTCCYPEKMEGFVTFLNTKVTLYMAFDYVKQRFYRSRDVNSDRYHVLDVVSGREYFFHPEGCRLSRIANVNYSHEKCFSPDIATRKSYQVSNAGQKANLLEYEYMENDKRVNHFFNMVGGYCYPVVVTIASDTSFRTLLIHDMKPNITTTKIYTKLENCEGYAP